MTLNSSILTKLLLWLGAAFFFSEFFLHLLGLPILEHDRIFLYTHDRYIALYALTYAFLLVLSSTDLKKYRFLFLATMVGILLGMLNAYWIAHQGGYHVLFPTVSLDEDLSWLGAGFLLWYGAVWTSWGLKR